MKTSLMAAAMIAAVLSAATAEPADESRYGTQGIVAMKRHGPSMESSEQAIPVAVKTTPVSIEGGIGVRRRAALATLFLIGAGAPCVRAEGRVLIAGGC
jgi:hypothetical protein